MVIYNKIVFKCMHLRILRNLTYNVIAKYSLKIVNIVIFEPYIKCIKIIKIFY